MAEPWGGSLPLEVKNAIDDMFPGSEERRKIAYTLMFYNHRPSTDEQKAIASAAGRSKRTVSDVLRALSDNDLFTDDLGSVPLYRHIQKMGAAKLMEGFGDMKGRETGGTLTQASPGQTVNPLEAASEANPLDGGQPEEDDQEDAGAPMRRALPSSVEVEQLRGEFGQVVQRMDQVEATVDKSLKEILEHLRARAEAVPLSGAVPLVQVANPLTVDPPDESVEVEQEPVRREEDDEELGPFAGMSKKALLDMAVNDPDGVHAMMRGYTRGERTIMAAPETMRWMGVMLSTYTQSAYERSLSDGYEGTLSDFLNDCVFQYFADRGKVLQWADLPQPGRMPYPQRRMG